MKLLRTSAIAAGLLVVGVGAGLLLNRAANARIAEDLREKQVAAESTKAIHDPVFVDWFALGSGCRARQLEPGDVEPEVGQIFRKDPLRHEVRFHMPAYHLALDSATTPSGARECSIRLAVTPASGFRIHDVRARTRILAQRPNDAELRLNEELKLGNFSIGASRASYSPGVGPREISAEVNLGTDLPDGNRHPETACGAPKLVSYDFTWIAKRGESGEAVRVDLGGEKTLDIEVIFEPCTALDAGAMAQGASQ